jgi:hypothetical protein
LTLRKFRNSSAVVLFLGVSMASAIPVNAADAFLKTEDLVAKHLEAIGSAEARTSVKTRVVQGRAVYRILVGGGGRAEGKTGLVSEDHKFRFMVKLAGAAYVGETFIYDGQDVRVAFSNSNQSRSPLASFIATYDSVLRERLLGGVLSIGWALADTQSLKPKLIYEGLKKVDGRQLHQLRYQPHKHSDVEILLFFEPETFRHVKTVYSISVGNNVGADILQSAKQRAERSQLEERFSDFKTVDGLTLPAHWNLQFTRELPDGSTTLSEWDLNEDQIENNMGLDPRNFRLK